MKGAPMNKNCISVKSLPEENHPQYGQEPNVKANAYAALMNPPMDMASAIKESIELVFGKNSDEL
jgi:hypothetical protein